MQTQTLTFPNPAGARLSARLEMPTGENPLAYALFAHCFTCTKNLKAIVRISRALAGEGIAVLRFDFTGLGESEGDFADTNFSSSVEDLVAAADFLGKHFETPRLLLGHSFGGAAVLQAAARIPSCAALVTLNAPAEPGHLAETLKDVREKALTTGEAEVTLAGRTYRVRKQFFDDLEAASVQEAIRGLNRPLLILQSPQDTVVGADSALQIFQAAGHPKSLISLDGADHLLSDEGDALRAGALIAAWARPYIGGGPERLPDRNP